jgi:serine/threonine protein kinase
MILWVGEKYEMGRKIGGGAFGEVFEGRDLKTGEEVAIKLEEVENGYQQLVKEAEAYCSLQGAGKHLVPSG